MHHLLIILIVISYAMETSSFADDIYTDCHSVVFFIIQSIGCARIWSSLFTRMVQNT